ncbi:MAG: SBBP repeat-containing protein, partial [Methanolinea sp.]|nr:SBBP repeat-containing protein [Methanolinea sp.]
NAYITGYTSSGEATFPIKVGPDLVKNSGEDAFVAKVNSGGTDLTYCGYIGGSGDDWGTGIAVDTTGHAYVTGYTDSSEASFPVKGGPDLTYNGWEDAFIAKVNSGGTALMYCGYIGGGGRDYGNSIAVDVGNHAYVAGDTNSSEATFPVKKGPDLFLWAPGYDAFIAKLGPDCGIGVFRPDADDNWIIDRSFDGKIDARDHYGVSTDIPLIYDFKGDWVADRVVFRDGEWIFDWDMDGSVNSRSDYGMAGDIPLAGDFNINGISDQAVFRPSEWNNWIYDFDRDGDVDRRNHFGSPGDVPLVGDFNNDGIPDRTVFRSSVWENWIIDLGSDGSVNIRNHFGQEGDIPVIGDFNMDSVTDRAVFRNGEWIMDYSMDGDVDARPTFGMAGDTPLAWD